jgi:hypothetical protein
MHIAEKSEIVKTYDRTIFFVISYLLVVYLTTLLVALTSVEWSDYIA